MAEILCSRDAVLEYGHLLESLLDFPGGPVYYRVRPTKYKVWYREVGIGTSSQNFL